MPDVDTLDESVLYGEAPPSSDESPLASDESAFSRVGLFTGQKGVGDFKVKVLLASSISTEDGAIKTQSFLGRDGEAIDAEDLYGFTYSTDLENPNFTVDSLGFVAGTEDTGSAGALVDVEKLTGNSLGIGFFEAITNTESGSDLSDIAHTSKIFFHYSNLIAEPEFTVSQTDVSDTGLFYSVDNPVLYSEEEENGLRAKFGVDPSIIAEPDSIIAETVFREGIASLAEQLVTTYAVSEKLFPRTPPLNLKPGDISLIAGGALPEPSAVSSPGVPTATATTEAVTATTGESGGGSTDTSVFGSMY